MNGDIYVGGQFTNAGGVTVNNIAKNAANHLPFMPFSNNFY